MTGRSPWKPGSADGTSESFEKLNRDLPKRFVSVIIRTPSSLFENMTIDA